jgi:uncharacterized membrane protein required for colicin V production
LDWLDLIIVCVVVLGGWNGYRTGLFRQITRLFGAVIAYFVSLWLRPYVAPVIRSMHIFPKTQPHGVFDVILGDVSDAASFAVVFVVTFLLLRYAAGLIDTLFSLPVISTLNRLAGLVVGLALAIVFVYVSSLILKYVDNPAIQAQLRHSAIIQWMTANQGKIPTHGNG